MQVKKFEAKSMKEALELVKTHLGPEAIILSAKDTHRGFGLMGEKSVEVTAAVTEDTLRKKKVAESKLREELLEKFQQIPASKQKEFINRVHRRREASREMVEVGADGAAIGGGPRRGLAGPTSPTSPEVRAQLKGLRYIDIGDDDQPSQMGGRERVRRAAQLARQASPDVLTDSSPRQPNYANAKPARESELENQVRELKEIVDRFQKMPQFPMSMHPGAEAGLPFELSGIYQRLTGQGVQVPLVVQKLKLAAAQIDRDTIKKSPMVDAWMVRHLLATLQVSANPTQGRYHVFLGTTGQGKSSSLIKFASHLVMKERRKIAIVSMDTIKLGAAEQLRIFAQILNVPFAIVRSPEEWRVAEQKLKNVQHILVDPPGFNMKSMDDVEWLRRMLPPPEYNRSIHYVQSILARDEESLELASRYQAVGFHDVIFTRLDETSRYGLMVNFQERLGVPIHSFGTGIRIPEDFEIASKERIVDFIFNLSRSNKNEEIK